MKTLRFHFLCGLASTILFGAAASTGAQVLLDDDFSDLSRTDQNLPNSSAWWFRTASGTTPSPTLSAATGALVYTKAGTASSVNLYTYFTPEAATDLSVGQTLTVSLSFSMSNIVDSPGGVRFGLFNSFNPAPPTTTTRIGSDGTGSTMSAAVSGYRGYSVWFNPSATTSNYEIRKRTANSTTLFDSGVNPVLGASGSASIGMVANTPISLSLSITRISGTELSIFSSVNGIELTRIDTPASNFGFDSFAMQFASNLPGNGNTITIDNISVTVVPEPSAVGLLGVGALGTAMMLRGRRRISA